MKRKPSLNASPLLFLALFMLFLSPVRTNAWGSKGHQVVARIASSRLSSRAREAIAQLLEPGETLESVSTWADVVKLQRPETRSWHFVAIPLTDSRYSVNTDCKYTETCIIAAIKSQIAILKDESKSSKERAEALKFLVHLIGDLHQPFHVTTNTNPQDNGASRVRVSNLAGRATTLASVWDNDLVDYDVRRSGKSIAAYAIQLATRSEPNISTQGSVIDWALEAHRLAWDGYYHTNGDFMVADPARSWALDLAYYQKNIRIVEMQLTRAGFRLAKILNDVFSQRAKF
jgi:S1/P1 Nuclease